MIAQNVFRDKRPKNLNQFEMLFKTKDQSVAHLFMYLTLFEYLYLIVVWNSMIISIRPHDNSYYNIVFNNKKFDI